MELGMSSEQRRDLVAKSLALQNEIQKFSEPDIGVAEVLALSIKLATFYKCISELLQSCAIEEPLLSLLQSSMDSLSCFVNPSTSFREKFKKARTLHSKTLDAIRHSISTDIIPLLGGSLSLEDEPVNLCHPEELIVQQVSVYATHAYCLKVWTKGAVGSFLLSDVGGFIFLGLIAATIAAAAIMLQQRFVLDLRRKELKEVITTANSLRHNVAQVKAFRDVNPQRPIEEAESEAKLVLWNVFRSLRAMAENDYLLRNLKNKEVDSSIENIIDVLCSPNSPLHFEPIELFHIQCECQDDSLQDFLDYLRKDKLLDAIFKKHLPKYKKFVAEGGAAETKTLERLCNSFETILRAVDPKRRGWQPTDVWGSNARRFREELQPKSKVQAIATMSIARPKHLPKYAQIMPMNLARIPLAYRGASLSLAKVFC